MFRGILLFILVAGVSISAFAQVQPPNTGKMSWDLFQQVVAGQRTRSAGGEEQSVTALLIASTPVTNDRISALRELGYTVLSAFGNFVLVKATAEQYTDPDVGINSVAFVSNATVPAQTIQNGASAMMIQNTYRQPAAYPRTGLKFTSGDDPG